MVDGDGSLGAVAVASRGVCMDNGNGLMDRGNHMFP